MDDELPGDPDVDEFPTELLAHDDKRVTVTGIDPTTGRLYRADGVLVVVPELHEHARRLRDA